jgi:hypothetical protein
MVAAGVIRLGGSGPFQQDLKGARIRLGDGVVFNDGGDFDCFVGGRLGPGAGVTPDCPGVGVGPGRTTTHASIARLSSH